MVEKDCATIARRKAAAWAWYQRAGGNLPALGRSEAFASRSSAPRSISRFKLEAQALRAVVLSKVPSEQSPDRRSISSASEQECLELVSLDQSWDCGSSLFDSFELVAMSKKLDAGLPSDPFERSWSLSDEEAFRFNALSLVPSDSTAQSPTHPTCAAPMLRSGSYDLDHKTFLAKYPYYGAGAEKTPESEKRSKQAIYEMFSHYSSTAPQSLPKSGSWKCEDRGDPKKRKAKNRMSLHGLSKALHQIAHFAHSGDQNQHEHHYYYDYAPNPYGPSKALRQFADSSHNRDEDAECRRNHYYPNQFEHKHFHHHYHHHYHYLFHSDDGFRLQPSDKSLIVAAAGLRTPKLSPLPGSVPFEIPRIDAVEYKRAREGY